MVVAGPELKPHKGKGDQQKDAEEHDPPQAHAWTWQQQLRRTHHGCARVVPEDVKADGSNHTVVFFFTSGRSSSGVGLTRTMVC